jgi:hypothetical protein
MNHRAHDCIAFSETAWEDPDGAAASIGTNDAAVRRTRQSHPHRRIRRRPGLR